MDVSSLAELSASIDMLWVIIAATLVFLMQAGFVCFEVGCVRPQNQKSVAIKNIVDWMIISAAFSIIGFSLMFGYSDNGFFGNGFAFLHNVTDEGTNSLGYAFIFFQLAFCATAATIVSGATSERTGIIAYLTASFVIGALIYPVFGHWVWGNAYVDSTPWLANLGFVDFAGSTVVHSVGGWVALVACLFIGPRIGRFDSDGNVLPLQKSNISWSVLGVFILWFGWWGFNGGSTLALDNSVGSILINTNIAAALAGITALLHCYVFQNREGIYDKLMGGVLGGLVAITACCHVVSYEMAALVGVIAGLVHNFSADFLLKKMRVDDPVGAIPVHLACGIWGTLCVALFGEAELLGMPRMAQLMAQTYGILACAVWTVSTSAVMFWALKRFVGLRVSPKEEMAGIDLEQRHSIRDHGQDNDDTGGQELSDEELKRLLG